MKKYTGEVDDIAKNVKIAMQIFISRRTIRRRIKEIEENRMISGGMKEEKI